MRQRCGNLVDHRVEGNVLEGRMVLTLTWQIDRLRRVAALLKFGDGLLPAPRAVERTMNEQEV